jgi:hypothetical protein
VLVHAGEIQIGRSALRVGLTERSVRAIIVHRAIRHGYQARSPQPIRVAIARSAGAAPETHVAGGQGSFRQYHRSSPFSVTRSIRIYVIALGDFRWQLYGKDVIDTGHRDVQESAVAPAPHPQNVPSNSILAQLDLAISFSETALAAPDREGARRSIVFARQLLDGVERSLDDGFLDSRASAEIESRLDWLKVLLRQCKEAHRQPGDMAIGAWSACNGAAQDRGIDTLPERESTIPAPSLAAKQVVRRPIAGSLNCHPGAMQLQQLSEQAAWQSLLLEHLDKFSAWLMNGVGYRLVLRRPWPNLYNWLTSARVRKRAASKPRQVKKSVRREHPVLSWLNGIGSTLRLRAR